MTGYIKREDVLLAEERLRAAIAALVAHAARLLRAPQQAEPVASIRYPDEIWWHCDTSRPPSGWIACYATPPPDDEAVDLLRRFVALVPDPPLVSGGYDSPPEHATMEDHELGYALHLARAYLARKEQR